MADRVVMPPVVDDRGVLLRLDPTEHGGAASDVRVVVTLVDCQHVVGRIDDVGAEIGRSPDQPWVVSGPTDCERRKLDEESACEHEVVDPVRRLALAFPPRTLASCSDQPSKKSSGAS